MAHLKNQSFGHKFTKSNASVKRHLAENSLSFVTIR